MSFTQPQFFRDYSCSNSKIDSLLSRAGSALVDFIDDELQKYNDNT